jgi:glycosyltransferase involved in cell wall biosynthesis
MESFMRVLFIASDVFRQSGGIARYCRLTSKSLNDSEQIERLDIVSLHDSAEQEIDARYFHPARGRYFSAGGNVRSFIWSILRLTFTEKYDAYLVGHVNFATLLWFCRFFSPQTVVVSLAYGIDVWTKRHWLRRIGMLRSDEVIAISQFTADKMVEANKVSPDRVSILYNCFDPYLESGSQKESNTSLRLKSPSLLTVSRVSSEDRHKGHVQVINALTRVKDTVRNVSYYIVGTGNLIPELQQLTADLKLESHVHFLGFVSDDDLRSVYEQCDLFVMPSNKEGFGYVFAEAMAYGKAVVAGNQDATVEVVVHGETGLLVDPANCEELAKAITLLLENPGKRDSMGCAGKRVVSEKFGFELFQQTLIGHLTRVRDCKQGLKDRKACLGSASSAKAD